MTLETTRRPRSNEKPAAAAQAIPAGFVACGCCGEPTLPADLYIAEEGEICHQCNAARESAETSRRGDRERAMGVFLSPAFTSIAISLLYYCVVLFTTDPAWWLAPVPAVASLVGVHAVYEAARSQSDPGDRVFLAAAGVVSFLVHALLALAMWGVVG